MRVLGYVRVSTNKQEAGPEVQVKRLLEEAKRSEWGLEIRKEEASSAGTLRGRPVLAQILQDLRCGNADMLAVSKLDRLSRSVSDFSRLLEDADREGWHLCCLDLGVDTSSITGRAMAQVTATFAEMERRRIGERTREGMARIKEATGKHMGRPATVRSDVCEAIVSLRTSGATLQEICNYLAEKSLPTATGGKWWPTTVSDILKRQARS